MSQRVLIDGTDARIIGGGAGSTHPHTGPWVPEAADPPPEQGGQSSSSRALRPLSSTAKRAMMVPSQRVEFQSSKELGEEGAVGVSRPGYTNPEASALDLPLGRWIGAAAPETRGDSPL